MAGQWIESVTDWAIRITDWGLFPDWVSSHARLADPIRPMPNKGKSGHSGLPIALISRLPDWVVQSVLPIAIHRLLHRLYPLAREHQPVGWRLVLVLRESRMAPLSYLKCLTPHSADPLPEFQFRDCGFVVSGTGFQNLWLRSVWISIFPAQELPDFKISSFGASED